LKIVSYLFHIAPSRNIGGFCFIRIFIVYLWNKIKDMSKKLPFAVNYTQEMSDNFNKELKESGKCGMKNPNFYGKWNLLEYGTPEYDKAFSKRKNK
jgi:hypothetical protein